MEKKTRTKHTPLQNFFDEDKYDIEIGIDEAGRGPLFGRLYVAAVILPKDDSMDTSEIRDSKKITKKKLTQLYDYIKEKSLCYHITYIDEKEIDEINIREAVVKGMHTCAKEIIKHLNHIDIKTTLDKIFLLIDGNDFPPYYHNDTRISYKTILSGDNTYSSIAAASILAKVSRDNYILELCEKYPKLIDNYGMNTHMGYGTKKHLEGIKEHGITQFHRKTYGSCKNSIVKII